MILQTERMIQNEEKFAKIYRLGTSYIVQFTDYFHRERSATAFCNDLKSARMTFDLICDREFDESLLSVGTV